MFTRKLQKSLINSSTFLKTVNNKTALVKTSRSFVKMIETSKQKQNRNQFFCNANPACATKLDTASIRQYSTNSPKVTATQIPLDSEVAQLLDGAFFFDAYETNIKQNSASALQLYLNAVKQTPQWIDFLMILRNRVVSLVGLKDLGRMNNVSKERNADSYQIGDRIGIFSVYSLSEHEVILADSDRHLNVKVSLRKIERNGENAVVLSTVVHLNNLLGRAYMFAVVPFHRIIVPSVLKHLALAQVTDNFSSSSDADDSPKQGSDLATFL